MLGASSDYVFSHTIYYDIISHLIRLTGQYFHMQCQKSGLAALLVLLVACLPVVADSTPALDEIMSPEDYAAAGLEKLSPAERAHLSEWIAHYREGAVAGPPPAPRPPSQMTPKEKVVYEKEKEQERNIEIEAKVLPAFKGWSGRTVFHLDNGQVWQQRQYGSMRYTGDNSTVVITQNVMGKYVLKHPETGRAVGVKRIR